MVIYVLIPADGVEFGYDDYDGFVVRAQSEDEARQLAYELAADGNLHRDMASWWLDAEKTICEEVPPEGEPKYVLASFHYG